MRFIDADLTARALDDYFSILTDHISNVYSLLKERAKTRLASEGLEGDEYEQDIAYQYASAFADIHTRLLRYTVLMTLWSVYFSVGLQVADKLRSRNISVGNDIVEQPVDGVEAKTDFLRLKKWFDVKLKFNLCDNDANAVHISEILFLRNIIAHNNGSAAVALRNDNKTRILKEIIDRNAGKISLDSKKRLSIEDGYLNESLFMVRNSLLDLIHRAKTLDTELLSSKKN